MVVMTTRPGSPFTRHHQSMPPTPQVEVSQLSPKQLRRQLKGYGIETGPILPTTRGIYERKLLECLTGQAPVSPNRYDPVDDDEDDEEVIIPAHEGSTRSAPVRRRPLHQTPTRSGYTSSASPSPKKTESEELEERGLPLAVKVCILVLVLFIGYLVYINLEPSTSSRIPGKVVSNV